MATGGDYLEKLKGWAAGDEIDRSKLKKCLKATPIGNKYTSAIQTAVETEMSKPGMTEKVKGRVNVAKNGEKLVQKIATEMKIDVEKVKSAIAETKVGAKEFDFSKKGGVDKLTDTSQYTGAHKERFDASGKGKGIDGRETKVDGSGYVGNYKGKGTFDKTH